MLTSIQELRRAPARSIHERRLHARRLLASPVYIERGDTNQAVAFQDQEMKRVG